MNYTKNLRCSNGLLKEHMKMVCVAGRSEGRGRLYRDDPSCLCLALMGVIGEEVGWGQAGPALTPSNTPSQPVTGSGGSSL